MAYCELGVKRYAVYCDILWYRKIYENTYCFCMIYPVILRLLLKHLNIFLKNSIYYMYYIVVILLDLYRDTYSIVSPLVNNDFFSHEWGSSPLMFMSDTATEIVWKYYVIKAHENFVNIFSWVRQFTTDVHEWHSNRNCLKILCDQGSRIFFKYLFIYWTHC